MHVLLALVFVAQIGGDGGSRISNVVRTTASGADLSPNSVTVTTDVTAAGYTATGTCTDDPADGEVCFDTTGIIGGQNVTTTDPQGQMWRAPACAGDDATCTAAPLVSCAGQDTSTITLDNADPSSVCSGAVVTFLVTGRNGIYLDSGADGHDIEEAVDWTATTDRAADCATLAAAIVAANITGIANATCDGTSVVELFLAPEACALALTEDTAACTTVSTGTRADFTVRAANLTVTAPGGTTSTIRGGPANANCTTGAGFFPDSSTTGVMASSGVLRFCANNTQSTSVTSAGINTTGTVTSSRSTDLGWSIVAAADQACNTTCTSACVPLGYDSASPGVYLACTDATADVCVCAGSN